MEPTVFRPSLGLGAPAGPELRDAIGAAAQALASAACARCFTQPALRDTVAALGAASRSAEHPCDELLGLVEALVRSALAERFPAGAVDLLLVHLSRVARRAHEQRLSSGVDLARTRRRRPAGAADPVGHDDHAARSAAP